MPGDPVWKNIVGGQLEDRVDAAAYAGVASEEILHVFVYIFESDVFITVWSTDCVQFFFKVSSEEVSRTIWNSAA